MIADTLERIEHDFQQRNEPFDGVEFPEERLLRVLPHDNTEEKLRLISAFASFDYNRDANQLVDSLIDIYYNIDTIYEPGYGYSETEMGLVFENHGLRYPNRDAHAWYENCRLISSKYNGQWSELLIDVSMNAPTLVDRLEADGFLVLKGDKVAPMYARIINDTVAPMNEMWQLDIPVDTHIERLTQDLASSNMTKDEIRQWWRQVGDSLDVDRHIIDGALWFIGNNWDDWGKEYWEEVTDD